MKQNKLNNKYTLHLNNEKRKSELLSNRYMFSSFTAYGVCIHKLYDNPSSLQRCCCPLPGQDTYNFCLNFKIQQEKKEGNKEGKEESRKEEREK